MKENRLKANLFLRTFGLTKVPMILYCWPSVIDLSDDRCEIKIPLSWRTKNHLGSMYFGALAVGADLGAGLMAVRLSNRGPHPISFAFKDMRAEFLKRAEGDVHFSSEIGREIVEFVAKVMASDERLNIEVPIIATVPSKLGSEPVAKFWLTLSMKRSVKKKD